MRYHTEERNEITEEKIAEKRRNNITVDTWKARRTRILSRERA
ncbi:hypothetical protein ACFLTY_00640 [Chloroflexota bacterium]